MGIGQLVHDVHPKHITTSRPGRQGSLGETVVKTRFRQSTPDMPWAYDPHVSQARANKMGNNVQDGNTFSYDSRGGPANVYDAKWQGNRSFQHQYGYEYHDVQSPDKLTEPVLSWLGDVSWRRKLARPQIIKRTGSLFLAKPNGYTQTGQNRGGLYPTSTSAGGIDPYSVPEEKGGNVVDDSPDIEGDKPNNYTNIGPSRRGVQRLGAKLDQMTLNK